MLARQARLCMARKSPNMQQNRSMHMIYAILPETPGDRSYGDGDIILFLMGTKTQWRKAR